MNDTKKRNDVLANLIGQAVNTIITKCETKEKIDTLVDKHNAKIHFIPKRYRIFGGLLQSMNIQFGNFIEELMAVLFNNEPDYSLVKEYSGKKGNQFKISSSNETRIDEYITRCQSEYLNLDIEFPKLLKEIVDDNNPAEISFKHDIDLLFKSNDEKPTYYYVEIKYNDDHDTGKFVDINRKFIKTYAYLKKELAISSPDELVPILFFFTNKRMKGNIYVPESTNIKRGKNFFDEFLHVNYEDVDNCLATLSESDLTVNMFNELYNKIMGLTL